MRNRYVFDYKKGKLTIPYEKVNSFEYGQKAGRRVAARDLGYTSSAILEKKAALPDNYLFR
jgi:hypothetical protein